MFKITNIIPIKIAVFVKTSQRGRPLCLRLQIQSIPLPLYAQSGKRVLRPTPLKALMSLTTPATTTKFCPDGQVSHWPFF